MNIQSLIRILIIGSASALSGCGGGDIQCNVAGSCTADVNASGSFSGNIYVTSPSPAASAPTPLPPAPPASAPTPTPPPVDVPFGVPLNTPGVLIVPVGQLAWTSGGMGYALIFREAFGSQFALLVSTANPTAAQPTWVAETLVDGEIDIHPPGGSDAAIRAYITTYVTAQLNAWLSANAGRFANGPFIIGPVSTKQVPTTWQPLERIAALVPQLVRISIINGVPVATLAGGPS